MPNFDPQLLQEWTSGQWKGPTPETLPGFSIDTRTLLPGEVFVALKTVKRDGRQFLSEAESIGAGAAIVTEPNGESALPQLLVNDTLAALQTIAAQHRKRFTGQVIGITGSCGKTSTKDLLASLLGGEEVHRSPGNFNNHLGVPLTLLGIDQTRHRYAVVEIGSSRSGELKPLVQMVKPNNGIITMVAEAHMEGFDSIEAVAREKAELGRAVHPEGRIVFTEECLRFDEFQRFTASSLVVVEEGLELPSKRFSRVIFSAEPVTEAPAGRWKLILKLSTDFGYTFILPAMSRGMVSNTVMALTLAFELGVSCEILQERLLQWRTLGLRGEIHSIGGVSFYVDCYNASPASMLDTFEAFQRAFPNEQPRIYLLGCMAELGERSEYWHQEVGRALAIRPQDKVFILGDYADALAAGLMEAGNSSDQISILKEVDEVRVLLKDFRGCVLLKGSRSSQLESVLPTEIHIPQKEVVRAC